MKIKLISAAVRSRSRWSQIMTLSLPAVAAATPKGHDITIEDERVKKISLDDSPDLVGISYEVFRAYRASDVAGHYRKKHIPVVLGGMHASVMPEEALLHHEKKFFMQSHVLFAENEELLLLAAKAGCIGVFVGIESVSAIPFPRPPKQ
jgi:radical SAM superfamily enzyme YgiQ (UPF0313 family)